MQESKDSSFGKKMGEGPDFELKLLVWIDTLMAATGLARLDLTRTLSAVPKWMLLSCARGPLYLLVWLSVCALLSYLAYDLTANVLWGLGVLVMLQVLACVALELRLRALRNRFTFAKVRRRLASTLPVAAAPMSRRAYRAMQRRQREAKAEALKERILRNQQLFAEGAPEGEREELKERVSVPLIGMALLAGLVCGSGGAGIKQVLREPMLRDVLFALGKLSEDFKR